MAETGLDRDLLARVDTALKAVSETITAGFEAQNARIAALEAELERFRSCRAYTIGFNDGFQAGEHKT